VVCPVEDHYNEKSTVCKSAVASVSANMECVYAICNPHRAVIARCCKIAAVVNRISIRDILHSVAFLQ